MELWAELRREHFVRGVSIKKLVRQTGLSRNTIRKALRADEAPAYRREPAESMVDPFKDEIHALLRDDPGLSGVRVHGELERLGFAGGITIANDLQQPAGVVAERCHRGKDRPGKRRTTRG